jgi:hypothetical protein
MAYVDLGDGLQGTWILKPQDQTTPAQQELWIKCCSLLDGVTITGVFVDA